MRALVISTFVLATLAVPTLALAGNNAAAAQALFEEARALIAAGNYAAGCAKLEGSQALDPGPGTQYNLALCYEKVGRVGSAYRGLEGVARLARETGKAGREDSARQKLKELRPRVSHLVITCADADAVVKVDGQAVEREAWSFYAVDGGAHTFEATAPNKQPFRSSLRIDAKPGDPGVEQRVAVPALAAVVGKTQVVTIERETSNGRRTAGFVVGGIGLAGVAAAVVTSIVIMNDKAIGDERCQPVCADESARSAVSTGKTLIPINYAAFGVAILGVGIGSYLVLTSGPKAGSSAAAWLAPQVGPEGGGASLAGRF